MSRVARGTNERARARARAEGGTTERNIRDEGREEAEEERRRSFRFSARCQIENRCFAFDSTARRAGEAYRHENGAFFAANRQGKKKKRERKEEKEGKDKGA